MPKRKQVKSWLVRYELTTRGVSVVEAATAEEAIAIVDGGVFESDPGEERIDWMAMGQPEPNE